LNHPSLSWRKNEAGDRPLVIDKLGDKNPVGVPKDDGAVGVAGGKEKSVGWIFLIAPRHLGPKCHSCNLEILKKPGEGWQIY
jgi:hypothetical protein